jgi:hypothetical protein
MRKRNFKIPANSKTKSVPTLALTHGQAIWLMTELGLRGGVSTSTFDSYIKSLRRLGIPFEKGKGQSKGHRHVTYDFEELMELTVALLLRVYEWFPMRSWSAFVISATIFDRSIVKRSMSL